jgi:hypothetical protein
MPHISRANTQYYFTLSSIRILYNNLYYSNIINLSTQNGDKLN